MTQLSTLTTENAPQRILIYGPPKSGKSVAAGMLSQYFNVLYIDLENAMSALKNNIPEEFQAKINYIKLNDSQDNPVAIKLLPDIMKGKSVTICSRHSKAACMDCRKAGLQPETISTGNIGIETVVVLDSFTQLTDSVIGLVGADLDLDDKFQYDHWGEVGRRLSNLMSTIQVAPYHIVAISHEQIVTMPNKVEKLVPTLGTRNTSKSVGRYFDHLVRMDVRNRDFKSYSAQGSQTNALVGSRSNLDMDSDPTLTLADLLKGKTGKALSGGISSAVPEDKTKVIGKAPTTLASK